MTFDLKTIYKDIKGFEGLYQIGNNGTVKCLEHKVNCGKYYKLCKEHIVKTGNNGRGYLFVNLWKNNKQHRFYIHRLVAEYFVNNNNPKINNEVDHIDSNKSNNNYTNLQWINRRNNKIKSIGKIVVRNDGKIYNCIKDAAIDNNIPHQTLTYRLNTNYYFKYKCNISFKYKLNDI